MINYVIRRLVLIPVTLFCIILVNFVIVNLAPGDPVTVSEISQDGNASRSTERSMAFGSDERYLLFREWYGLTLPILLNTWPWTTQEDVDGTLQILQTKKKNAQESEEMPIKDYDSLRVTFGDKSRYIMPKLLAVMEDPQQSLLIRSMASRFFARGGTRQGIIGSGLTDQQIADNEKIATDNNLLRKLVFSAQSSPEQIQLSLDRFNAWYRENSSRYRFEPTTEQKLYILFVETRFCRYMGRVLTLDFGTLRNDNNRTVISEVTKRFKYSLTLAIIPMLVTFVLCQVFGCIMAYRHNRWPDYGLSISFLVLYAIPVFVVAPFLIEEVALNHDFPFTQTPIPISGFTSPDSQYDKLNTSGRLVDVFQHIFLPLVAIMYGSMAAQSRLSRTTVLEVLRQDYVRTAWAKGLSPVKILFKHVCRNASITIVTSIASSLGVVLGGSLIVEALFEINGFGKFFYDAVINRDYNVIMFSSLAGSLLSLSGFLIADIAYTVLDPRLTLD
ncbi:MAG: ABC transporter permease [Parachlamydiaceae bacterium]